MNESLTRVPNNRSDEHAPRVQQHGQRHEEERVDYAHLKMMVSQLSIRFYRISVNLK